MAHEKTIAADPQAENALREHQLVDRNGIANLLGLTPDGVDTMRRQGRFPPAYIRKHKFLRWRLVDVLAWMQQQAEESEHAEAKAG